MKIIVNGVAHFTEHSYLYYDQIIEIAGYSPDRRPSVTFRSRIGPDAVREGCLSACHGVTLAEEMVFNVVVTGSA